MTNINRKTETKIVKDALKKAGITATVRHGKGTAWGWIYINLGDPAKRNGLTEDGYRYTEEELALQKKAIKIAQAITGRRGEYDGKISILAQE